MPELKLRFTEGELVARNYRVTAIAGSGGMGIVYRAIDERLNRVVALKFLPTQMQDNAIDRERFLREARVASSLDHPNIGVIHGVEDTGDDLCGPGGLSGTHREALTFPVRRPGGC